MNLNFINTRNESESKFENIKIKQEDEYEKKLNDYCVMSTMSYQKNSDDSYQLKQMTTQKTVNNTSCDPVLTQIALDTSMFLNQQNQSNAKNTRSLKRMSSQTTNHTIMPNRKLATNSPLNIFRFNPNSEMSSICINTGIGDQHSMSLPSNYSNLMECAMSNTHNILDCHHTNQTPVVNQMTAQTCDLENFQMDDSCITSTEMDPRISMSGTTSKLTDNHENIRQMDSVMDHTTNNNYTNLSTSLPAYTIHDYMNKAKKTQLFDQQQPVFYNAKICRPTHLNKLLTQNKIFNNVLNSASNISCANTTISSVQSIPSPISSLQDDYESINNTKPALSLAGTSPQDDDYDEQDSEDESISNDMLLDLMDKNQDTFFWQYNILSKGVKTKKVLTLRNKDPHLHREFFDPVYQLQTISSRSSSLNNLRKGMGNDVTPNSDKLYQLGLQIRDFIQKSCQMNILNPNSVDIVNSEKAHLKREKNKIASRVCRIKKKAHNEANKLKLHALNQEHKQIVETISIAKNLIKDRLKGPNQMSTNKTLTETLDDVCLNKLTTKVAGNTDNYVLLLMQNIENDRNACFNVNSLKQTLFDHDELDENMMTISSIQDCLDDEKLDNNNNMNIRMMANQKFKCLTHTHT
jgi:hypothetical protein